MSNHCCPINERETGNGKLFQDLMPQGCGIKAYKDVFTACPGKACHFMSRGTACYVKGRYNNDLNQVLGKFIGQQ